VAATFWFEHCVDVCVSVCLLQYFNIPVTADTADASNPINILKVRSGLQMLLYGCTMVHPPDSGFVGCCSDVDGLASVPVLNLGSNLRPQLY
jgi:hypothetical protein